jgi:hypothetical protein
VLPFIHGVLLLVPFESYQWHNYTVNTLWLVVN